MLKEAAASSSLAKQRKEASFNEETSEVGAVATDDKKTDEKEGEAENDGGDNEDMADDNGAPIKDTSAAVWSACDFLDKLDVYESMVLQDTLEILGPLMPAPSQLPSGTLDEELGEEKEGAAEVAIENEGEIHSAKDEAAGAERATGLGSDEVAPTSTGASAEEQPAGAANSEEAAPARPPAAAKNPLLQGGLSGLAEAAAAREARRAAKLQAEEEEKAVAAAAEAAATTSSSSSSGDGSGGVNTAVVEASASETAPTKKSSSSSDGAVTSASKKGELESSEMAEMQKMLEVYKKLMPMSDDEMKWKQKVLDTSVNTFVVAETKEEHAQRR